MRALCWAAVAASLLLSPGCVPLLAPEETCFEGTGTLAERIPLVEELMLELPEEDFGEPRIWELRHGDGNQLLIVSEVGATWAGENGELRERIRFSTGKRHLPAMARDLRNGRGLSFLGVTFDQKERVVVYDHHGRLQLAIDVPVGVLPRLAVGDVTGDSALELVVRGRNGKRDGVLLYSDGGEYLRSFKTEHYLTAFALADEGGDGKEELVLYGWPNEQREGDFEIYRGDGELVRRWNAPHLRAFEMTRSSEPLILTTPLAEHAVTWFSLTGQVEERIAVPHSSCFTFTHAADLTRGRRVFLHSGGGYNHHHMVSVVGADGELLYQEIRTGHAEALLVPRTSETSFLVARRNQVWRYSLGQH